MLWRIGIINTFYLCLTLKELRNRILRTILVWWLFSLKRLYRSVFSTVSFRKLFFRLSGLSLNQDIKICVISYYVILISNFVLTLYKKSSLINNNLFIKGIQYFLKTCLQRCFEFFKKKLIYKDKCGTVKKYRV